MTTATRVIKHIIQAHKAVRQAEELTQAKLDALLETNVLYKLFEPDTEHPYFALASAGKNTSDAFEALVAGVLDWTIDSGTITEEMDKAKARQIVDEKEADADLDSLRSIQPKVMTEAEVADKLLSLFHSASLVWSRADDGLIKSNLATMHGLRNVGRHKESPELKIKAECRAAVTAVKKLAKELRDSGNGNSTIRRELEKKQVMLALRGKGKDAVIEIFLK